MLGRLAALEALDLQVQSPGAAVLGGLAPKRRAASDAAQHSHDVLARVLTRLALYTLDRHARHGSAETACLPPADRQHVQGPCRGASLDTALVDGRLRRHEKVQAVPGRGAS